MYKNGRNRAIHLKIAAVYVSIGFRVITPKSINFKELKLFIRVCIKKLKLKLNKYCRI